MVVPTVVLKLGYIDVIYKSQFRRGAESNPPRPAPKHVTAMYIFKYELKKY